MLQMRIQQTVTNIVSLQVENNFLKHMVFKNLNYNFLDFSQFVIMAKSEVESGNQLIVNLICIQLEQSLHIFCCCANLTLF